jgi:hypothetical protein
MAIRVRNDLADLFLVLSTHERARANAPTPGEFVEEVVWLHTDMGPSYYLTRDGRILTTDAFEPDLEPRETSDCERSAALVLGARNLDAPQLLELLPVRPAAASDCPRCGGSRWRRLRGGTRIGGGDQPFMIICPDCSGRGWIR